MEEASAEELGFAIKMAIKAIDWRERHRIRVIKATYRVDGERMTHIPDIEIRLCEKACDK